MGTAAVAAAVAGSLIMKDKNKKECKKTKKGKCYVRKD
jgi:hypothetical protein